MDHLIKNQNKADPMAIYNLGSINADYFYHVPHLPGPGETLAATDMTRGLGGKGANMTVAAARAGAHTCPSRAGDGRGHRATDPQTELGCQPGHLTTRPALPMGHPPPS